MAFCTMTVIIFLLILNFIQFSSSVPLTDKSELLNHSFENAFRGNESSAARSKRYTRWGGDQKEGSPEFLVQVLDDDLPAAPEHLLGLNIYEERPGKLQLGSVMMPSRTSVRTTAGSVAPLEYTRFMPPRDQAGVVTRAGGGAAKHDVEPRARVAFHDASDLEFPLLLSNLANNPAHRSDAKRVLTGRNLPVPRPLPKPAGEGSKPFLEMSDVDEDDDSAIINIENMPQYKEKRPTLRTIQFTEVPKSNFTKTRVRPTRSTTAKTSKLPALRSTKLLFTNNVITKMQSNKIIIYHSTRLYKPRNPTRSTRPLPGVFEGDKETTEKINKGIADDETGGRDMEDDDRGMDIDDKRTSKKISTYSTKLTDKNNSNEDEYDEPEKDRGHEIPDYVNTPKMPDHVTKFKPSRSTQKTASNNFDEYDETDEKSKTDHIDNGIIHTTRRIRTSVTINWSQYDDSESNTVKDDLTDKFKTSTHRPQSTVTRSTILSINEIEDDSTVNEDTQENSKTDITDDTTESKEIDDSESVKPDKNGASNDIERPSHSTQKGNNENTKPNKNKTEKDNAFDRTTEMTSIPIKPNTKPPSHITGQTEIVNTLNANCSIVELKHFTFMSHHKLAEITLQLRKWADNPLAKLVDIGNGSLTHMENSIHMVIVDDRSRGQDSFAKQTILVVAGIQGRDHNAVSAAMYMLYELIERAQHHAELLSKFRFWIIPVLNPDGYEYSTSFPEARNWRKNMRQSWETRESCADHGINCVLRDCRGVHLDRNFEYQWISDVETHPVHPCGDLYAGERQLSEPETQAYTRHLQAVGAAVYMFFALKEGDVLGVLYPYSHTKNRRASDATHRIRARHGASAAESIAGRKYVFGQASEFLPLYAGGIEDWMEGHQAVDNSYTVMLHKPYDDDVSIEKVCHEGFAAVDTMLTAKTPPLVLTASSRSAQHRPFYRRGTADLQATLLHICVYCFYFAIYFTVVSFLRTVESIP